MSDKEKEILEEQTEETVNDAEETVEQADENTEACDDAETVEEAADEVAEETENEQEDNGEAAEEKEGGILKNFKKKDKKLEALEKQKTELEDRVMRQMAEFQNFRTRSEKEKASMYEMGAKAVIEKILPVIDNFERGLQTIPEDQADSAVATGMQMIYKQLTTELENIGVKPIDAVGKEFDANLHNAVMQVESDEYESGIVAQELQKGYMYRDSVVRHSMVSVVQ